MGHREQDGGYVPRRKSSLEIFEKAVQGNTARDQLGRCDQAEPGAHLRLRLVTAAVDIDDAVEEGQRFFPRPLERVATDDRAGGTSVAQIPDLLKQGLRIFAPPPEKTTRRRPAKADCIT